MNNYLNIHILNSLAFANPNRDDAGAPKSCYYGGVERARMSSQSLKRAARVAFESASQAHSIRSAFISDEVIASLESRTGSELDDADKEHVDVAVRALVESNPKARKKAKANDDEQEGSADSDDSGNTLMWLAPAEVAALVDALEPHIGTGSWPKAGDLRKMVEKTVKSPTLSIAAFGRMFAASPDSGIDAAVQVSHAVSTHTHSIEVDYFTAVDDLREHGAGHLGLSMYTGAVYYRHVSIDRAQLQANIGAQIDSLSDQLGPLLTSILLELPTGKQNSAAHQSLPALVVASPGPRPTNCVEAFEQPVESDAGYVHRSAKALAEYINDIASFMPSAFDGLWVAGRPKLADEFTAASSYDLDGIVDQAARWLASPAR